MIARTLESGAALLATLLFGSFGALHLAGCNCSGDDDDDFEVTAGQTTTDSFGGEDETFAQAGTSEDATSTTGQGSTSQGSSESEAGKEPIGSPCAASAECESDVCATWYDDNKHGNFGCEPSCIELMDETRWCRDADACCDAEAECTARGYCLLPGTGTFGETGSDDVGTSSGSSSQ